MGEARVYRGDRFRIIPDDYQVGEHVIVQSSSMDVPDGTIGVVTDRGRYIVVEHMLGEVVVSSPFMRSELRRVNLADRDELERWLAE